MMPFEEFADRAPKEWGVEVVSRLESGYGAELIELFDYLTVMGEAYNPEWSPTDNARFILITRDICEKEAIKAILHSDDKSRSIYAICQEFLTMPFEHISATRSYETLCKLVEVLT